MFSVKSPPIWDDIMLKLPRPDHHDGLYDHWSLSSYLSTPSCLKLCFHKSYPTISVEPCPWFSPANILSSKASCGQAPTSEDEAWWTEGNAVGWRALLCAPASSSWNYSPPSHYSLFNLTSSTHTLQWPREAKKCNQCNNGFSPSGNLRRHIKTNSMASRGLHIACMVCRNACYIVLDRRQKMKIFSMS